MILRGLNWLFYLIATYKVIIGYIKLTHYFISTLFIKHNKCYDLTYKMKKATTIAPSTSTFFGYPPVLITWNIQTSSTASVVRVLVASRLADDSGVHERLRVRGLFANTGLPRPLRPRNGREARSVTDEGTESHCPQATAQAAPSISSHRLDRTVPRTRVPSRRVSLKPWLYHVYRVQHHPRQRPSDTPRGEHSHHWLIPACHRLVRGKIDREGGTVAGRCDGQPAEKSPKPTGS